jgi:LPXTG-site transpeptidase (sortase) family protein
VYRVVAGSVVGPDDTSVLSPRPGVTLLTLITCTPVFSTARRLIRHAELIERQPIG